MKLLLTALLLVLGIATVAAPVAAWPYIDVTASEALSLDPPRYRTTFVISFAGYEPGGYYGFTLEAQNAEPVATLYECAATPDWSCGEHPAGVLYYFGPDGQGFPWPSTFSVVTDQQVPCVRFYFLDPLLAKAPSLNDSYAVDACLLVDAPVPTRPSSWGSMKSRYR